MLARYTMVRGARAETLPRGIRQDTRKHTHHVLRPTPELVEKALAGESDATWKAFAVGYRKLLEGRFREDRAPFDALAALARANDVLLGCSCPSAANPDVMRCHTVLALRFMKERYPDLDVVIPAGVLAETAANGRARLGRGRQRTPPRADD